MKQNNGLTGNNHGPTPRFAQAKALVPSIVSFSLDEYLSASRMLAFLVCALRPSHEAVDELISVHLRPKKMRRVYGLNDIK